MGGTLETLPKAILSGQYEPVGRHYSSVVHDLVSQMLQVDPAKRLDLNTALTGMLNDPLQRSRDALGLEPPSDPGKSKPPRRADRMRKEVQNAAQKMQSEWIGFNTMCRRSGPIIPAQPDSEVRIDDLADGVAAAALSAGPASWSKAAQRDPDSEDDDI